MKIKDIILTFINSFKILLKEFLDLIYKRKCINCGCSKTDEILCKNCLKTVQKLPFFAQDIINEYKVYSCFYYEGIIKKLILELKFKHNKPCSKIAAKLLYEYILNSDIKTDNLVIIPVLTHRKNYLKRGYDNVLEIAKELSLLLKAELNYNSLLKIKYTKPQYKMNYKQRQNNIKGSFILDENFNTDKNIILIDDILTTGATLDFITSLFKERGIKNLVCLTLSKTKKF